MKLLKLPLQKPIKLLKAITFAYFRFIFSFLYLYLHSESQKKQSYGKKRI